ncbi:MAG: hypothetical protein P4L57_07750, partial [Rhizomicrobium sp.]|nr:hypothetical protein [Rhizomicrobium sp.]
MEHNKFALSRRGALGTSLALGMVSALPLRAAAATAAIAGSVDVSKPGHPIADYMYGGFIEHIGNLINYSYWSEILDDRKFYYPIDSKPVEAPKSPMRR